jgi:hypothetical protein
MKNHTISNVVKENNDIFTFCIFVSYSNYESSMNHINKFTDELTLNNIIWKCVNIPDIINKFCIEISMKDKFMNIYDNIQKETKFLTFDEYKK